eukprot:gnl/MRDRNA2_/MRDRNA2_143645_c0_seq1.p1 gnl/MRDRNA2_/MRDRNA2_143645_c0~~gnl/MRDRNA2_/MRDRNA2_143645_c0_seq1.p1  ORF type:complete len:129 (-),score=27.39 gnl/MRDRNA2_/MRDRNA2_143645_c0_seq1:147-533(-)
MSNHSLGNSSGDPDASESGSNAFRNTIAFSLGLVLAIILCAMCRAVDKARRNKIDSVKMAKRGFGFVERKGGAQAYFQDQINRPAEALQDIGGAAAYAVQHPDEALDDGTHDLKYVLNGGELSISQKN